MVKKPTFVDLLVVWFGGVVGLTILVTLLQIKIFMMIKGNL